MSWWGSKENDARKAALANFDNDKVQIIEVGASDGNYFVAWQSLPTNEQPRSGINLSCVVVGRHQGSFRTQEIGIDIFNVLHLPKNMRKYITKENVSDYDYIIAQIEKDDKIEETFESIRRDGNAVPVSYAGQDCLLSESTLEGLYVLRSTDGRILDHATPSFAKCLVSQSIKMA